MHAEIKNTKARKAGKLAILGGAALLGMLASQQQAYAQCAVVATSGAFNYAATPMGPAAVNALVSVIGTVNTAFLTQSSAFVSAPGNPQPDQPGGGVWTRGVGGSVENKATGTIGNFVFNPGGVAVGNPSFDCNTTVRTDFAGYQSGVDIARLNFGGSGGNAHLGVTAGYVEANSKSGTFSGKFEVPFVGIYGAFTRAGFFADAQVRWDFYHNTVSDAPSFVTNQQFDARSISATANMGYQFPLQNNWFVEPSVGVVWSRTTVNAISVAGDPAFTGLVGDVPPGTVQINPIESTLGRASLRVGTNVTSGNMAWQPFATASVLHEFSGNVLTNLSTCIGAPTCTSAAPPELTSTLSTSRVGTYGQFALGVAGQVLGTGWLGYIRGDYRKGEDIEGWSVNGGVRYQFTPEQLARTGVFKAPVKAPVAVVGPYNWSGFYFGANLGTTWGTGSEWTDLDGVAGLNLKPRARGFLGGGQVGLNYQVNSFVLGVEADYDWSNASGAVACPNAFFTTCHTDVRSVGTAAGRVGYAWDRTLFYAKGGAAWVDARHYGTSNITGATFATVTDQRTGWMAGGGFEFGLTPNWSAKAEYNYMDFGKRTLTFSNAEFATMDLHVHAVKLGVNYRFGGWQ